MICILIIDKNYMSSSNHCKITVREDFGSKQRPYVYESYNPWHDQTHPESKSIGDQCPRGETGRSPISYQHPDVYWGDAHVEVPLDPSPILRVLGQISLLCLCRLLVLLFLFFYLFMGHFQLLSRWRVGLSGSHPHGLVQISSSCLYLPRSAHDSTVHGNKEEEGRDYDICCDWLDSHPISAYIGVPVHDPSP